LSALATVTLIAASYAHPQSAKFWALYGAP